MTRGIGRIGRGAPIRANWLNKLAEGAELALGNLPGPRQVDGGDVGTGPQEAAVPDNAAASIQSFVVITEGTDTVSTLSVVDSTPTTVAKPVNLQGNVSTRIVSGEAQIIVPSYTGSAPIASTIVFAANVGETQTGIAGVTWQDLNVNGRMWAEDT